MAGDEKDDVSPSAGRSAEAEEVVETGPDSTEGAPGDDPPATPAGAGDAGDSTEPATPTRSIIDIAHITAPDRVEPVVERLRKRAVSHEKNSILAKTGLMRALEQTRIGGLERTMRDLGIGGFGTATAAGRLASGNLAGLSAVEKAALGIGSFLDRDTLGLTTVDKLLGSGSGNDIVGRVLAEPRDRDRLLSTIGGFRDRTALAAWARPLGGIEVARWAEIGTIGNAIAGLSRTERWARGIGSGSLAELAASQASRGILADQVGAISRAAEQMVGGTASLSRNRHLDSLFNRHPDFESTARKLSMFAGALDIVGPGIASLAAYEGLLGDWRTRSDLPASFWRHPEQRARRYRDADVDPGLIDADNAELVEMLVETGVVEGESRNGRTIAVVEAGPVKVRVTAARPRQGATRVLAAFELGMRGFVEAKLRAAMEASGENPEKWFNRRMPGDVVRRSRERRESARLAGEPPAPPIAFVDLGDFIDIVTQRNNWPVFEPVFGSADEFRVDIARLNAIRRPIAHLRPIDPVQLAETTLTVARLTRAITLNGGWDAAWDDED